MPRVFFPVALAARHSICTVRVDVQRRMGSCRAGFLLLIVLAVGLAAAQTPKPWQVRLAGSLALHHAARTAPTRRRAATASTAGRRCCTAAAAARRSLLPRLPLPLLQPAAFPNPKSDFQACGREVPGNICDPDLVLSTKSKDYVAGVLKAIWEGDKPYALADCGGKAAGYQVGYPRCTACLLAAWWVASTGARLVLARLPDCLLCCTLLESHPLPAPRTAALPTCKPHQPAVHPCVCRRWRWQ